MTDAEPPGGHPEDPLLRAVAEYWDEIQRIADENQQARLRGLIAGTAESDPVEARAALADELMDLLPPDHPLMRVLSRTVMYSGVGQDRQDADLADDLRRLSRQVLRAEQQGLAAGAQPTAPGEFDQQVEARLLDLPFLSPDEVRRNGADPDDSQLIRLPHPDDTVQLPAFQFTASGEPWPIVKEVNERLDAASDPWGVTCWWVDPHARLEAVPADLLGQDKDGLLRSAAAAVGEDY